MFVILYRCNFFRKNQIFVYFWKFRNPCCKHLSVLSKNNNAVKIGDFKKWWHYRKLAFSYFSIVFHFFVYVCSSLFLEEVRVKNLRWSDHGLGLGGAYGDLVKGQGNILCTRPEGCQRLSRGRVWIPHVGRDVWKNFRWKNHRKCKFFS